MMRNAREQNTLVLRPLFNSAEGSLLGHKFSLSQFSSSEIHLQRH
jgi:hypothetical protein